MKKTFTKEMECCDSCGKNGEDSVVFVCSLCSKAFCLSCFPQNGNNLSVQEKLKLPYDWGFFLCDNDKQIHKEQLKIFIDEEAILSKKANDWLTKEKFFKDAGILKI